MVQTRKAYGFLRKLVPGLDLPPYLNSEQGSVGCNEDATTCHNLWATSMCNNITRGGGVMVRVIAWLPGNVYDCQLLVNML
jgi:hypothetical protein